ncbi:hypothetical protein BDZ89DRAFT_22209 [Hymenopellis radicata]|nr:hypothetical protein BDZ89DRAFT_22209 [Hymenopellis radicata]
MGRHGPSSPLYHIHIRFHISLCLHLSPPRSTMLDVSLKCDGWKEHDRVCARQHRSVSLVCQLQHDQSGGFHCKGVWECTHPCGVKIQIGWCWLCSGLPCISAQGIAPQNGSTSPRICL